jgi:hypothetical protein
MGNKNNDSTHIENKEQKPFSKEKGPLAEKTLDDDIDEEPELYTLIDGKNLLKGKLVELMQEALRAKNFANVEKFIRENVSKFLLNGGIGDLVPLSELLAYRKMTAKEKRRKRKKKQAFKTRIGLKYSAINKHS